MNWPMFIELIRSEKEFSEHLESVLADALDNPRDAAAQNECDAHTNRRS